MAGLEDDEDEYSDGTSTEEDIRFDLSRERDINVFSDNCSPDSEADIIMCDFPLPRGSFWSGSLTSYSNSPSIDFWVMVAPNSFSSSLWYFDDKENKKANHEDVEARMKLPLSRIRVEWSDQQQVRISNGKDLELIGILDEDFPFHIMGIVRKRGESTTGEFYIKKRDVSRNVYISLGGSWIPAHIIGEEDEQIECVVLYSKPAVADDVVSLTLTVREDRIRRGRAIDHCILTTVENVLLNILEFTVSTGEELQLYGYLSTRIQALINHEKCNLLWKSMSLRRWPLLEPPRDETFNTDSWRLFYLSRQQFDYPPHKNHQTDYLIDVQSCPHSKSSDTIEVLNSGKLRYQYRCPFRWDHMKEIKNNNEIYTEEAERKCRYCKHHVKYVPDIEEANLLIQDGATVAVPLVPEDSIYSNRNDLANFPELNSENDFCGKIKIDTQLPDHLKLYNIPGLRKTFDNMERNKSFAELVSVLDSGPRRLDLMDTAEYRLEIT